ncbi:type II toxin-antitoxin system RelE/ParE family toxin [Desulfatirhabdium butyrativorans]|uniref:type II toxin-antitoxin system RelE/ParE family toxin n=1 Tax=Desulfatirhabdium butyrativorans TaxID=340467 RepID=UPI000410A3BF|nr:type II toxin-antitoxin system RelE/ParE family toxin [Desulfatirhabdium butyrativorans]
MIRSFRCKRTQELFEGKCPLKFKAFSAVAERKLQMLDNATSIADMQSPPGNRLEALQGSRAGQWSIRINDRWRICFRFDDCDVWDVEIVDYH